MSKSKKTLFQPDWLTNSEFRDWVQRDSTDTTKFKCKVCPKSYKLGNMGRQALMKHGKGATHTNNLDDKKETLNKSAEFFLPKSKPPSASGSGSTSESEPASTTIQSSSVSAASSTASPFSQADRIKAETIWCLQVVKAGYSDRSNNGIADTLQAMLPGTLKLQMQPTNVGYMIQYGLYPYFQQQLINEVNASIFASLSYDECLNKKTQDCQLDIQIRFWGGNERVVTRYWDSKFLGHTTARDLERVFEESIQGLDPRKFTQISMDGPNVNLLLLKNVQSSRAEGNLPKLLDIGTCNLHTLHLAFKHGAKETGWDLQKIMKAAYITLHDTPARREDYKTETGSTAGLEIWE